MTDREALMQAVLRDPDNDGPRLIYADWLDEHGENGRAEFIRVQCELVNRQFTADRVVTHWPEEIGRLDSCECRPCRLRRREQCLLNEYGFDWFGEFAGQAGLDKGRGPDRDGWRFRSLGGTLSWCEFYPGFVGSVTCTLADWLVHGPAIVACQPVERVECSDKRPFGPVGTLKSPGPVWHFVLFDGPMPHHLPSSVFNAIRPAMRASMADGSPAAMWPAEAEAFAALSAACLSFARTVRPG